MSPEALKILREQCCDQSGEIQIAQFCLADGKPARFVRWINPGVKFEACVNGNEYKILPWTKLQRHLTDAQLIEHFPSPI